MNERRVTGHKPRLLFVSQVLPYPPDGGVKIRTFNILRLLARPFDVVALCFYRQKGGRLNTRPIASVTALRRFGEIEAFQLPHDALAWKQYWDHIRSIIARRVYTYYVYESGDFSRRLAHEFSNKAFDIVHFDSLDLSRYIPAAQQVKTVCVHHDAESDLLRRRAAIVRSKFLSRYLLFQAELMEKEERKFCPRVDLNVTVSARDSALLRKVAPGARFTVVPNGVDTAYFQPRRSPTEGLVFVGGTTWFPNADALEYFARDVLPILRARLAGRELRIRWIGRASQEEQKRYSVQGIEMTGYVDDIRPYVEEAACYIVPLRVGGGTRIKILDAWAMGKAIVSTSIGCSGLDARDGRNILIRDSIDGFVEAIVDVLEDEALRIQLGLEGRATVEAEYSWEVIGNKMVSEYYALMNDSSQTSNHSQQRLG